jgi:hypothetical protein
LRTLPLLHEKAGGRGEKSILPECDEKTGKREEKRGILPELQEKARGQGEKLRILPVLQE